MPLDVFIQHQPRRLFNGGDYEYGGDDEYVCAFDHNGYFCFFTPLFEQLAQETGQYIDLYGGEAVFTGATLEALRQTLLTARSLVEAQPEHWEVIVAIQEEPEPENFYSSVYKKQMYVLLDTLTPPLRKRYLPESMLRFSGINRDEISEAYLYLAVGHTKSF